MSLGENGKYTILPNSCVLKRLWERNHEKILHFFRKREELTEKRSEVTESLRGKKRNAWAHRQPPFMMTLEYEPLWC